MGSGHGQSGAAEGWSGNFLALLGDSHSSRNGTQAGLESRLNP